MDPKKLPPAVLLALGLSACGRCGEAEHVGPCLSVVAPPDEPPAQACLSVAPPSDDTGAPERPVGPCLSIAPPPEEPDVGPCLEFMPERVGPCLSIRPPEEVVPNPGHMGPCLSLAPPEREPVPLEPPPKPLHCLSDVPDLEPELQVCLSEAFEPDEPPQKEGARALEPEPERQAVLEGLIFREALPADVIETLTRSGEA